MYVHSKFCFQKLQKESPSKSQLINTLLINHIYETRPHSYQKMFFFFYFTFHSRSYLREQERHTHRERVEINCETPLDVVFTIYDAFQNKIKLQNGAETRNTGMFAYKLFKYF